MSTGQARPFCHQQPEGTRSTHPALQLRGGCPASGLGLSGTPPGNCSESSQDILGTHPVLLPPLLRLLCVLWVLRELCIWMSWESVPSADSWLIACCRHCCVLRCSHPRFHISICCMRCSVGQPLVATSPSSCKLHSGQLCVVNSGGCVQWLWSRAMNGLPQARQTGPSRSGTWLQGN